MLSQHEQNRIAGRKIPHNKGDGRHTKQHKNQPYDAREYKAIHVSLCTARHYTFPHIVALLYVQDNNLSIAHAYCDHATEYTSQSLKISLNRSYSINAKSPG